MPDGGILSLAIVCEADADRAIATGLTDRVLCAHAEWIEPVVLDAYREWRGLSAGEPYLKIHQVPARARERKLRAHGHFESIPGEPMAHVARLAFLLLASADKHVDAVVILIDSDDDPARRKGLLQAREVRPWPFPIIIGVAHAKRECWVLGGYIAEDELEAERIKALRQELGFDPCKVPHELTAQGDVDKRSAKRILAILSQGNHLRETACWQETNLATLVETGQATGLADYVAEVRERLVPLFVRA